MTTVVPASPGPAPDPVSVQEMRNEIRQQPTSSGPGDFAVTLELLDKVDQIQQLGESMVRLVEDESGLRRSEFTVLRAVNSGESHPRRVGRKVGLQTEAVLSTAESLSSNGMLGVGHDPSGRPDELFLTDAGRSILSQAEAVQIRATDAAVQQVGPDGAARALVVLDTIITAMAPIAEGNSPEPPHGLPTGV